ncbi:MAG: biosynthetic-type acetolactate synthase large subunit [Lachnospiraceae bacterium]|nr:biosynthetic-type acetolactate synthase large subunit [Lachnospiraceae bacterium]
MKSKKITGAEILVRVLIEQGTDIVFGYPGGQVMDIYESLFHHRKEIKHILTAHEQGAAHAADGYARATGKTGVVIATSGPGATNLVTGIAAAYMDSIPVVAITGNVPTSQIGTDSFQEVDITGITIPITKHNFFVDDVAKLAGVLRKAFLLAASGRPGPVLVDIPKDVQEALFPYEPQGPVMKESPFAAKDIRIKEAAAIINQAKRPYIYFGGGIISSDAEEELLKLSELTDAPMGCSMMGISAIPSDYPRFLGMQGMHGHYSSTVAMNKADVIIALGVRFNDRSTNDRLKFEPNAKVVHIDIDGSELSKTVEAYCGLRGELKQTLQSLLPLIEKRENEIWWKNIKSLKNSEAAMADKREGFTPANLYSILNKFKNENTPVVTDVGQHQVWASQYMNFYKKRKFISNCGLGAMGYGMGAAIGASFGLNRKEKVLLITGDGSFGMNLNELATAVTYNIPMTIVILNNHTLGMVRQLQTMFYHKHYSATDIDRKTDFVLLANSFGLKARKTENLSELEKALKEADNCKGPFLIECVIDKDESVLPMFKPGGSTEDIITEI